MQSPPLCYKSGLNSVAIPKCQHPFRNANFNTCFMMRNARLGRRLGGLSGWLPVLDRDEDRRKRIIKESLRICGTGNCISSVTPVCHLKTGSAKRNNAPDERSPRSKNVHMLSTGATSRMKRIVVLFINNATCKKKKGNCQHEFSHNWQRLGRRHVMSIFRCAPMHTGLSRGFKGSQRVKVWSE